MASFTRTSRESPLIYLWDESRSFLAFQSVSVYNIHIMKRINIYISDRQNEDLRQIALDTDVKFAEHVRRALDAYIKRVKREKKRESV